MQATITVHALKRLIAATKDFVFKNSTNRPIQEFIKLDFCKAENTVTAVALDGYRLSVEHADCTDVDEDFTAYIKPTTMLPRGRRKADQFAVIEVRDGCCYITVDGYVSGYRQPQGEFFNYKQSLEDMTRNAPAYCIGFNGDYLLSALQSARMSLGNCFRSPVVLEFRGTHEPVIIRTNRQDVKVVLPVRLGNTEK